MAELDERLNRLISDEDSMKRILELASAVMSGQNGSSSQTAPPQATPKQEPVNEPFQTPDLSSVLGALGSTGASADPDTGTGNTSSMANLLGIMPQLFQALSGDTSLLQNDRVNLIRAMQPYMSQNKAGNIERAMRMANLTKVAKDVLKLLGR